MYVEYEPEDQSRKAIELRSAWLDQGLRNSPVKTLTYRSNLEVMPIDYKNLSNADLTHWRRVLRR